MVKPTGYTDDLGRLIDTATLGEEIAMPTRIGVRRVTEDAVASGLLPERLAGILRQAATGDARAYLTLAEEMEERYLHYASQLQTRRLAIEGVAVSVEHDEKVPAKIVEAANGLVEGSDFDELVGALTDGIAKGYSAVEIIWDYRDGLLRPARYKWRDPRFFVFDDLTGQELRLARDGTRDGEPIPAAKFIVHSPRSKMGLPVRRGMARPAAWAFLIQSFALKDWASFAEIYGVPLRVGKYNTAASDADKRSLLQAVRSIANDAAAIIPIGMEMEFVKVEGQHGAAVFGGLIDYTDKQVSKLVLGQTMTSDDGGSLAQAKVHDEVRLDILAGDAKQIAQTLNRDLMRPFVDLNFGPQPVYPRVALPVSEPEDIKALTDAVKTLVPLGLRVGQRGIRERVGIPEPEQDEELLAPPAAATAELRIEKPGTKLKPDADKRAIADAGVLADHVAGCRCGGCLAALDADPNAAADGVAEVEALAAAAIGDWENVTDPIMTPIRHAMTRAASIEQFVELLGDGPDTARLAEHLARRTATARGVGDVRD